MTRHGLVFDELIHQGKGKREREETHEERRRKLNEFRVIDSRRE